MRKIVVNGVDGNFGALVAEDVLQMIPKEDLLFTAPRADRLEKYAQMGIKTAVADFNSPIQATSEGMVTFGTTVRKGFLDVAVSDFTKLTGKKPITVKYMFEHSADFQLGERHPTE